MANDRPMTRGAARAALAVAQAGMPSPFIQAVAQVASKVVDEPRREASLPPQPSHCVFLQFSQRLGLTARPSFDLRVSPLTPSILDPLELDGLVLGDLRLARATDES